jgi:hypothetical protein
MHSVLHRSMRLKGETSPPTANGASPQPDERCGGWAPVAGHSGERAPRALTARWRLGWPWRAEDTATGAVMTLPRTVADVLSGHVVLEVQCIDRLYLNVY